jgi:hypothetical protein
MLGIYLSINISIYNHSITIYLSITTSIYRKNLLHERINQKHAVPRQLTSVDKDYKDYPFLQAIANREELVRYLCLYVSICLCI